MRTLVWASVTLFAASVGAVGETDFIRAHPRSLDSWRTICNKQPEHDADHSETDEGGDGSGVTLEVARQAPAHATQQLPRSAL
jgi:hypothetical protein